MWILDKQLTNQLRLQVDLKKRWIKLQIEGDAKWGI